MQVTLLLRTLTGDVPPRPGLAWPRKVDVLFVCGTADSNLSPRLLGGAVIVV